VSPYKSAKFIDVIFKLGQWSCWTIITNTMDITIQLFVWWFCSLRCHGLALPVITLRLKQSFY